MEAVTYKCPDCGGVLKFDTESGMMLCDYCIQYFPAEMFAGEKREESQKMRPLWNAASAPSEQVSEQVPERKWEQMKVRIYQCQSCGAEMMTGDQEVSRICSFCGNPTIMFDRISEENKPDKIIPFMMTKEEALRRVKERFQGAILLECDINEIKTDSIYPIYMPYWVYKMRFGITLTSYIQKSDKYRGKYTETSMDANTETRDVPMDASKRFQDDISMLLNPFRLEEAVDFNPAYLSGFYADRSDVGSKEREIDGRNYMRKRAVNAMLNRAPGVPGPTMRRLMDENRFCRLFKQYSYATSMETFDVLKTEYMLLPVYFMTIRVNDKPIIILVNGQTGKIVGNIPVDEKKLKKRQLLDMMLCAFLGAVLGAISFNFLTLEYSVIAFFMVFAALLALGRGWKKRFIYRFYRTNTTAMAQISKDRK